MNITETKEYMYIPENYFGDGAPGYRVNKEIVTHQEAAHQNPCGVLFAVGNGVFEVDLDGITLEERDVLQH